MFNNASFSRGKIRAMKKAIEKKGATPMHETAARLYEAVKKLKNVEPGPTTVARLIHCAPQNVKNWETRGISAEGMIDCERYIGCSVVWLADGAEPMEIGAPYPKLVEFASDGLADALKLTTETSTELQMLSVFRLANKDEREAIGMAVEGVRLRLRRDMFGDDTK